MTAATALVAAACVSSAVDPRCAIDALDEYVDIDFTITHLASRATLFRKEESVSLDSFIVGVFDGDASRDQIQKAAFKATEENIFPFVDRWINIAAIRAMAEEGFSAFTPILEEQVADPWSEQLAGEAKAALEAIRGS